jgi:hypothetical protein
MPGNWLPWPGKTTAVAPAVGSEGVKRVESFELEILNYKQLADSLKPSSNY